MVKAYITSDYSKLGLGSIPSAQTRPGMVKWCKKFICIRYEPVQTFTLYCQNNFFFNLAKHVPFDFVKRTGIA